MSLVKIYPICKKSKKKNGSNETITVDLDYADRYSFITDIDKDKVGFFINYYEGDTEDDKISSIKFEGTGTGDFEKDIETALHNIGLNDYSFLVGTPFNFSDDAEKFVDELEKIGYKYIRNSIFLGVIVV